MALFGGQSTQEMKKRLGVPDSRPLADFLPTIIIKVKDFANEITNFNIKKDGLRTEPEIAKEHVKNNTDVRKLLVNSDIRPERFTSEGSFHPQLPSLYGFLKPRYTLSEEGSSE